MEPRVAASTDASGPQSAVGDETAREHPPAWRAYLGALGPGLITGASDDDPSGVATYAQAGAQFRYALLWTALITWPLMTGVQEICDRIGIMHRGGLVREGALNELIAIENQTELVLENATPELMQQLRDTITRSGARVVGEQKPQQNLERYFLDVTSKS